MSSTHHPAQDRLRANLIHARREAGLTQRQLAERLGRPQSFVAKVELGDRRLDVVDLVLVARALGVAAESLLPTIEPEEGAADALRLDGLQRG